MMSSDQSRHRFLIDDVLSQATRFRLSRDQSSQIRKVLRLQTGDHITLFDGCGQEVVARISGSLDGAVEAEPVSPLTEGLIPGPPDIHLGVALLKADRFDFVVQKSVELGVKWITPMETDHCVVRLRADRVQSRLERWKRIATEALEQSGRADNVTIHEPAPFDEAITSISAVKRLIAWEQESRSTLTGRLRSQPESVAILIGPEGGYSESEVVRAEQLGFQSVSLGSLKLRSDTAAIAALAMIRSAFERNRLNDE